MRIKHQIEQRIRRSLDPEFLRIVNESSKHRVPEDAETHFDVTIVSNHFADTRMLERHRRVQNLLADELAGPVHALSLHTYTSGEWQRSRKEASAFPACAGGDGSAAARADLGSIPQASTTSSLLAEEGEKAALPPLTRYGQGDSPFGSFTVAFSKKGLAALFFGDPAFCLHELRRQAPVDPSSTLFEDKTVAAGLNLWLLFAQPGTRPQIQFHVIGTPLQLQVWRALLDTAPGQTISYKRLAASIGRPSAVRAVASAVGANPISWLIPCHRVVGQDGSLRGYRWGLERKRQMLSREEQMNAESRVFETVT